MTKTNEMKRVLRTAGINTKFVKISHSYCGYDEYYGEILMGGNTYLWVQYD